MGVHDGHRERLKRSYIDHGLESFSDIMALELLLFYAVPRRDTNVIAHELIKRFDSIAGVFSASVEELQQVSGIGESAAALIHLLPDMIKRVKISRTRDMVRIMNSEDAGKFLIPRFSFEKDEVVLMVCLDSQRRVIKCSELARGVVNTVNINIRKLIETAIQCNAEAVIISHNHPGGVALPSNEDCAVTKHIYKTLSSVGITLADHIIVAGEDFVSFADSGFISSFNYC